MNSARSNSVLASSTATSLYNRPGLDALAYRIGDYDTFLENMLIGLSNSAHPQLKKLTTRDLADPAIALLDAWAIVGDVLTFYQERIANENYLRTATERFSIAQLAQLVGYKLRPGVSASTYLAFTVQRPALSLDDDAEIIVPASTQAQSIPAPGQTSQLFETSSELIARPRWNSLGLRLRQPATVAVDSAVLYVDGVTANLKPNDRLLVNTTSGERGVLYIAAAETQFNSSTTKVTLQTRPTPTQTSSSVTSTLAISSPPLDPATLTPFARLTHLASALSAPPALHPPSQAHLTQRSTELFKPASDVGPALLAEFMPGTGADVYSALANEQAAPLQTAVVSAFRVSASPFGSNAPLKLITNDKGVVTGSEEWSLAGIRAFSVSLSVHPATSFFRSAGTGISDTGQLSASAGFIATVSFTKAGGTGDEQESGTIAITPNQTSGTVKLGDWKVTCTEKTDGNAVSNIEVQFQSAGETHRFTFAETNGAMTGAVDAGAAHPLAAGQTIRYSLNNGRVAFTFSPPQAGMSANPASGQAFMHASYQLTETPDRTTLALDSVYDQILPQSTVILERPDWAAPRITHVTAVSKGSIAAYGITGKVTQITLADAWGDSTDTMLSSLRQLTISAQSEALPLAPAPVIADVAGARIELDGLYSGLTPGRWLVVQGERTDIPSTAVNGTASAGAATPKSTNTPGVRTAELVMLAGVEQDVHSGATDQVIMPGDTTHTTLVLSSPLAYTYARTSVSIFGNVAFATHGQSRAEILGNGDRSQAQQEFTLGQKPLTYVAATRPDGIASTLQIRVNDLLWQEQRDLYNAGPNDHVYTTQTAEDTTTTVLFGDGTHGSRLSTGTANVRASYRSGIGAGGNLAPDQISQLASQPLGVQGVTNPRASTGGADPESGDSARGNVAVALTALDRLVSIQDYADFSRAFAGVGKSSAVSLSDGMQQLVYVTIAGEEDIPIATDSALYLNLTNALATFGDPGQAFAIGIRDVQFLVLSAQVTIDPAYDWTVVAAALRTYLLKVFSFDARSLGQPVYRSEVIAAIQSVAGVSWVEIGILESVGEPTIAADLTRIASSPRNGESIPAYPARQANANGAVLQRPAQLIYLNGNVPDTLILNQGGA